MPKLKFDAHDVAAAACEVRRKALGTWLSNVYDLGDKRTFLLKFARSGGRTESGEGEKIVLLLESGVRFHTTSYDKTSPSLAAETNSAHAQRKARQPSPFCAKLRMHLRGKRLAGLTQMGADRAIDLAFGAGPNAHHLILECFAQGNLVLTDAEYRILTLLRPVRDDDNGLAMLGNHPYPLERRRPFVAVTREKLRAALEGGGGGGAARGEGEEDEKGAAGVTTEEGDRGGEERREPAAARAAADVEGGRRTQTQKTQNPSKKPSSKTRPGGPPSSRGGGGGGSSRPPATLREALCRDLGLGPRVVDRVARSAGFGAKGGGESPKAALESPDAFEKVFKALAALDEWRESLETFSSEEGEDVEQRTEEEGEGVGEQNASSSSGTPNPAGRRSRVVPGYLTVERGTLEAGDGSSKTDDSPDGGATGESSSPPPLVESASAPDYVDFSPFPPEPSEEETSSSQKRTIVPFASGFDDALDAYFAAVESRAAIRARDRASKNALKRAEKVKLDQARRVASLAKEVATAALHAELVERNVEAVDVALNAVNAALAGGQSWGDLERTIAEEKRAGNPVARSIREMRLAENRVSVALPRAGEEAEEETSGGDDESDASESGGGDDESAAAATATAAGGERDSDSDSDSDDSSRRRRGGKKNKGGKRNGSRHRLVAVSLDLSLSAHANARFHHDRRKALEAKLRKTERANAHGAVDAALARRGALDLADAERRGKVPTRVPDAGDVRRAPEWFEKFHWFVTPERCLVVSARDAAQADALVLKYMGPDDAYVHADVQGAPPTLVKAPTTYYVKASKASAAKSEASAAKSSSDEGASDDALEKLVSEKLVVSEKKRSAEEKLSDGLALPKVLEGWCGRVPPSSLAMAGAACLCRSSAWDQRAVMSAWWARPRDVAKATPEGDPLPSGVAWTTGPRTHLPPAPLVMGFAYAFTLADEASVRRHGGLGLGLGGIADIIAEGTGGEVVMREEGPEEGRRTTRAIERRAADDRGEGGGGGEGGEGGEGVGVEGPGEGDGVGSDRGGFRDDRPESSNDAAGEDAAAEGGARATTTKLDAFLDADVLSGGLSGLSLGGGPTTPTLPPAHPAAGEDEGGGGEDGEGEGASSEHPSAGASVEPSADPERSGRSGRISAKARRDLKKARRRRTETGATDERPEEDGPEEGPEDGPEDEDRSDEDRSSSSGRDDFGGRAKSNSKTGAHQTLPGPGPGPGPQGPGPQKKKKLSRGKAAKAKRAAARYADQDDEDRELAAALAAAAGEKKEKGLGKRGAKGKKGERGKNTAAAVWGEEDPAADREGGILAPPNEGGAEAVPNGPGEASSTASSRTTQQLARTRQREDQQRARAAAGSYSPAFVSDPAAFAAKNAERMSRVAVFAGAPGPGDAISHAVAIVAPWPALRGFRYKAKLTPGTQKKGKAAKQAAEICQKAPVDFKEMRAVPRVASETAAEDVDSKATNIVADGEKGVSLHARDGERAFKALDKALRERMRLSALKNAGGDLAQIMCGNGVKVSMPAGAAKAINAEKRGKKKG